MRKGAGRCGLALDSRLKCKAGGCYGWAFDVGYSALVIFGLTVGLVGPRDASCCRKIFIQRCLRASCFLA